MQRRGQFPSVMRRRDPNLRPHLHYRGPISSRSTLLFSACLPLIIKPQVKFCCTQPRSGKHRMSKMVDAMESQPLLAQGFPSAEKSAVREWRGKWWHLFGNFDGNDVSACCLAWKFPCVAWAWNQNRGLQFSFIRELLRFIFLSVALVGGLHFACCLIMSSLCPQALPQRPEHGDFHGHMRDEDDFDGPKVPEECLPRLVPAYVALFAVALAAAISLSLFFARRRTAIRERYAIQGSTTEDAVMYLCCAPCALAQETRTLMHEQVHDGVWYGALPGVQAPPAFAAPSGQKMSA